MQSHMQVTAFGLLMVMFTAQGIYFGKRSLSIKFNNQYVL